ncbi:MAG TPA: GxxExxY protein [Longimicrobiales bacterium]|nr:GxxExxY protein [Longimicrobiales bacterium]
MAIEGLTERIIGAAMTVHRGLGPGLLESTYEACLAAELTERGLAFERQLALPVVYKGIQLDCGYRLDLLVERTVVVELKSVERLDPIYIAQLVTYLKLSAFPTGLLINFNVKPLKDGIRRLNRTPAIPPPLPSSP